MVKGESVSTKWTSHLVWAAVENTRGYYCLRPMFVHVSVVFWQEYNRMELWLRSTKTTHWKQSLKAAICCPSSSLDTYLLILPTSSFRQPFALWTKLRGGLLAAPHPAPLLPLCHERVWCLAGSLYVLVSGMWPCQKQTPACGLHRFPNPYGIWSLDSTVSFPSSEKKTKTKKNPKPKSKQTNNKQKNQ